MFTLSYVPPSILPLPFPHPFPPPPSSLPSSTLSLPSSTLSLHFSPCTDTSFFHLLVPRPPSGSVFFFNKKEVGVVTTPTCITVIICMQTKTYRNDGHQWKTRRSNANCIREDRMKLKLHGYKAFLHDLSQTCINFPIFSSYCMLATHIPFQMKTSIVAAIGYYRCLRVYVCVSVCVCVSV